MKKYEPAGGVCEIQWKKGFPVESEQYGQIILEQWEAGLGGWNFQRRPEIRVSAKLRFAQWCHTSQKWLFLDGGKEPTTVRRWARLCTNNAWIKVTVGDWL